MDYSEIINFWFKELKPEQWFSKNSELDLFIKKRFLKILQAARRGELYFWRINPLGRLAEIIVLDQFSRNIYRNSAEAFSSDTMALTLAQEALVQKIEKDFTSSQKAFLYLPFQHSESPKIQEIALELFTQLDFKNFLKYQILHKNIIDRFGRYPHRNSVLKRKSTPEELEFLNTENSSF